jgi:hypothetical protein
MQEYMLKQHYKLLLPAVSDERQIPVNLLATFLRNIEDLGFTLSPRLMEQLLFLDIENFQGIYFQTVKTLKEMVGAYVVHRPMYPNFPRQVMEMEEAELYINAMLHYLGDWVGLRIMPQYAKDKRLPYYESIQERRVIDLGTEQEFHEIIQKIMASKVAMSPVNKETIKRYLASYDLIPVEIPNKENLAVVAGAVMKSYNTDVAKKLLSPYFKTATDVLRLATALSEGDVSLAARTTYKKFSRKERRLFLSLLDTMNNLSEDMNRHRTKWVRLGEILHPSEYKNKYGKIAHVFKMIRSDRTITTWNSGVEEAFKNGNLIAAVELLKQRPGMFARKIDKLFRLAENDKKAYSYIYEAFGQIIKDIPSPLLLQLYGHYKYRNEDRDLRVFFPKGVIAKVTGIRNKLPSLPFQVIEFMTTVTKMHLQIRFQDLDQWGKVYLDPELENHYVPFALRSENESLETYTRGSKLPLGEGKVVRFFIHWKDISSGDRVDVDLSALALDKDFKYVNHIGYTNLREKTVAAHSGDITSAPNGASEFIDYNIDAIFELKEQLDSNDARFESVWGYKSQAQSHAKTRYIVMLVNSYTQQGYNKIPECFAGWMMRSDVQSGEIFEPASVKNKSNLASDTKIAIPMIIDIIERKVIWCDLALKAQPNHRNNVHENLSSTSLMAKAMVDLRKPSLYDLFYFHALGRAEEIVDTPEEADLIINQKTFKTHEIISDFL